MINFRDLENKMSPNRLRKSVESILILPDSYKIMFDEISKEEFENILVVKEINKKNARRAIQNMHLVDISTVELFGIFCNNVITSQTFKPAFLKRLILRSVQGLNLKILPLVWLSLSKQLRGLSAEKDPVLEFYDNFISGANISAIFSKAEDLASFDEHLKTYYVQKGSTFYDSIFYSFLRHSFKTRPGLLNAFNVWDIIKNSEYSSDSIPLWNELILSNPFPVLDRRKYFFDKLSIDELKLPDIFSSLSNQAKLTLKSWRNTQNLLLAFSKASGMEDRKEFWPRYSMTVLNVYFSPHPNNIVMMEFPDHYVIEFVENGNACFFYPKNFESIKTMLGFANLKKSISLLISSCTQFPGYDGDSLRKRSQFMQENKIVADYFKRAQNLKLSHIAGWKNTFSTRLYEIGNYTQDNNDSNRHF